MATVGTENQPPGEVWRENRNTHLICTECQQFPPDLIEDNADTICANCGMVLAERLISTESEWRTFNSDEAKGDDPNRVGDADNELFLTSNAGTQIGGGGPNVSRETRKLKKAQAMQQDNKADKALQQAYAQIDTWSERAKLGTNIRSTAKGYYKQVYEESALRGKSLDCILAASLFIACRQWKAPRSFTEIMALTTVPKKDLGRVYKQLEKFLQKRSTESIQAIEEAGGVANRDAVEFKHTESTKPEQLCERYNNMLGGPFRITRIAGLLAQKIPEIAELAGRSPLSNAAACVYFASHLIGLGKSTKQISEVAGVSDATIKHAYKYLFLQKEKLVEPDWLGPQAETKGGFGDMKNLPGA